jgi:hypothetical protein
MIDEADRDGDGEINQEEFLRIMRKTVSFLSDLVEFILIKVKFLKRYPVVHFHSND